MRENRVKLSTHYKVPFAKLYPSKPYVACIDIASSGRISPAEFQLIRSYIMFRCIGDGFYDESFGKKMAEMAFAEDDGINTLILHKDSCNWLYRLCTWNHGMRKAGEANTLTDVLDYQYRDRSERWDEWKESYSTSVAIAPQPIKSLRSSLFSARQAQLGLVLAR